MATKRPKKNKQTASFFSVEMIKEGCSELNYDDLFHITYYGLFHKYVYVPIKNKLKKDEIKQFQEDFQNKGITTFFDQYHFVEYKGTQEDEDYTCIGCFQNKRLYRGSCSWLKMPFEELLYLLKDIDYLKNIIFFFDEAAAEIDHDYSLNYQLLENTPLFTLPDYKLVSSYYEDDLTFLSHILTRYPTIDTAYLKECDHQIELMINSSNDIPYVQEDLEPYQHSLKFPYPITCTDGKHIDGAKLFYVRGINAKHSNVLITLDKNNNSRLINALKEFKQTHFDLHPILKQLDKINTTVYVVMDQKIIDLEEKQLIIDLYTDKYKDELKHSIFDQRYLLVYSSYDIIPDSIKINYNIMKMNFMRFCAIFLAVNDWIYVLFDYLNGGFPLSRQQIRLMYYNDISISDPINGLDQETTNYYHKLITKFPDITKVYLYHPYNREGTVILVESISKTEYLQYRLFEMTHSRFLFIANVNEYKLKHLPEPFYVK